MIRGTVAFLLLIYLLFTWGCGTTIKYQKLSPVELERVQAVKVFMEEKDFNGRSYQVIQKVQGCANDRPKIIQDRENEYILPKPNERINYRDKAVEQVKIQALRAGSNAITNLVCLSHIFSCGPVLARYWAMECEADVIKIDCGPKERLCDAKDNYGEELKPFKTETVKYDDCDPGMESCD